MIEKNKFIFPPPPVIRIEPAGACNFRCKHCTIGLRMNKSVGIMQKEVFDKIFEKIKHLNFRSVVFYHGGEPLLNQHLFYFMDKTKSLTNYMKIVCNGSLLTDEKIEEILNSPLSLISFSLDGVTAEENDSIRRGSDFEKITKQIVKLLKRIKETGSNLQVDISNVQFLKEGDSMGKENLPLPPHLKEAFKDHMDDLAIKCYPAMYWPGYPRQNTKELDEKPIYNRCDNLESTITIRWNGDVVACCYDLTSMMVLGNILEQSLEEIWNGSKYIAVRSALYQYKPASICKGCNAICKPKYLYPKDLIE